MKYFTNQTWGRWNGWLAAVVLLVMAAPLRASVLLSDTFSDGQISAPLNVTGPDWTVKAGSFSVGQATQSADNHELVAASAGARMEAVNDALPGDIITLDLDVRSAGGSGSGGRSAHIYLIDDAKGGGLGFRALISRRDKAVILELVKTADRGESFDVVSVFGSPTYDASNDYQHLHYQWDRTTGTFTATLNGVAVGGAYHYTAADLTALSQFNTTALLFDSDQARVDGFRLADLPEPSGLLLAGSFGGLVLMRRRASS